MEILHSRENAIRFFVSYVEQNKGELKGKQVYDLSTGTGFIANMFREAGADLHLYDLFPEQIQFGNITPLKIDLQKDFNIADGIADFVICSETIECLPDHFHLFKEISRILKPKGKLLLTSASPSTLRSRFSQFLMESEHYSFPMPDETNAFVKWPGTSNGYFNKIFISGILRIRTLAAINALKISTIHKTRYSSTSILLLIFYPWIYFFSKKNLKRQLREAPQHAAIYNEIFTINTSLVVLLSKHLIIEFTKSE